ncbi:hypothetical protein LCC91_11185 [Tepidimonas taiwanensis]|uniref:Zinc-ribbon domain protein n=1 Tax=Tepidimonas taiwanensis TaxID=307486 RepID=A0A554X4R3_9BURK|nr:hypothetical protein [Tepidimonas taiwanensis]MCX7692842.1 hypothetical protein [Tepidimonas taiwanensis]TSE30829.1 hypothetical protein Ttaiw_01761 [Tepidimonas taiwanensis]UBQ05102.1 hypothetical protein LCC91_11185 [Tepidimonas taiwanensis]
MSKTVDGVGFSSHIQKTFLANTSLLSAVDAITRWQPFSLLALTSLGVGVLTVLFGGVTAALSNQSGILASFVGLVGLILVLMALLVGSNAVGIMLSDDVWGRPQRNIKSAILASLFTVHRLIGVIFLVGVIFLLYLAALSLILFLCKIPGVGALLYAIVFPVGAVLTGFFLFALLYVAIPLAAPVIWNGETVLRALTTLREMARHRLLFVIIMMLLLGVLVTVVTAIIGAALFGGAGLVLSMSAAVVGSSIDGVGGLSRIVWGALLGETGLGGYLWALGFGGLVLFFLGVAPGSLVAMKGLAIIHRAAVDGLELERGEEALKQKLEEVKRKAQQARDRMQTQAAAVSLSGPSASSPAGNGAAANPTCPSCTQPVSPADIFCGNCGHRLQ